MKKIILLFSGGLDSTILLNLALRSDMIPYCLLVDYSQKHVAELEYAKQCCNEKGIEFQEVQVRNLMVDSKLTGTEVKYEGVSEWHVPSRNLMFISFALAVAESKGIDLIWYGANYEDRINLFPDCYQEWVYSLNQLIEKNGSKKIKVEAPLLGMTKETIQALAKIFNVNKENTFSGYEQR